ncbi:MAG: DUF3108 domain-containing protein [Paramuribaculum sp.]|nr:DUF3108 domain-containing protein [Paramuribaculum sp.]MDE6323808.1 DUF3108 domain-containing protein [Paramuribaculum sp.]MDE6489309.1 DUF3108 domain-containing protein [Paramuribaculum sp.]
MKRTVLTIAAVLLVFLAGNAMVDIPRTSVGYDVIYHWGLINKIAGHGYVTYHTSGPEFYGSLNGHSIPWGGRIYTVHSSLAATFSPGDVASRETVNSIQGVYSKPEAGSDSGRHRFKDIYGGGTLDASPETMEAVTVMSNMLSIFYYAKTLDFDKMTPGTRLVVPVVDDGEDKPLYITYNGPANYSYGGFSTQTYEIVFQYTYEGEPDRYPVTCQIDRQSRVPVMFSADLLIGHIEMCYVE